MQTGQFDVIYIEPYPKSRTGELYSDSISVNPSAETKGRVVFRPFVGVAPRRYFDFFQMVSSRKDLEGDIVLQESVTVRPKVKRYVLSYLLLEEDLVSSIQYLLKQKD